MSEQLDYEATKAALRAQSAPSRRRRIGWRWTSASAAAVTVVCAVVVTVWITRDVPRSEIVMVPSAGHDAANHSTDSTPAPDVTAPATVGRSADTTATVVDGSPLPVGAPERSQTGVDAPVDAVADRPASGPSTVRDAGSVLVPPRFTGGGRPSSSSPGTVRPAPGQTPPAGPSAPSSAPGGPSATEQPAAAPSPTTGGGSTDTGDGTGSSGAGAGSDDSSG